MPASDDVLELLLTTDCFLLPADNIPDADAEQAVLALGRGPDDAAGGGAVGPATQPCVRGSGDRWREVHGVWLLAGSAGATGAIQDVSQCLQRSHRRWPLSMPSIWIPPSSISCSVLRCRTSSFPCLSPTGVQTLEPARLVMISPRYTVALNEFGQLTTTREAWSGQHTPDINELLVILSAAKLPAAGRHHFQRHGQ